MARPSGAEFERLIECALDRLVGMEATHSPFRHRGGRKRALDVKLLADAARRRGLGVLPLAEGMQLLGNRRQRLGFYMNMPWTLSRLDRSVTNDKELTKRILQQRGIPVARGQIVRDVASAVEYFRQIGPPVAVKPIAGSGGRGITVDVRTEAAVADAVREALSRGKRILIEESISSIDIRLMVVAGRVVASMLRVPAHVTGDGVSTIAELLAEKNRKRRTNAYLKKGLLAVSPVTRTRLAEAGLDLDSVLPAGVRFFLHFKANLSSGGDSFNISGLIHPELMELAERAAACFPSARHAGIDILAQRFDTGPAGQRCVVCEVNCNNDMPLHMFPMYGPPIDTAQLEIDSYFPRGRLSSALPRFFRAARPISVGGAGWRRTVSAPRLADWPDLSEQLAKPLEYPSELAALEHRSVDVKLLATAFAGRGLRLSSQRSLLWLHDGGRRFVVDRSGTSVFAHTISRVRDAWEPLLRASGIAVCSSVTLNPEQWDEAMAFCDRMPGPWNLRPSEGGDGSARYSFHQRATLERAWPRLAAQSPSIVLEQAADDLAAGLLLIGGEPGGCVLHLPTSLVGDGAATIADLLEHKAAVRAGHPYLRHWPVRVAAATRRLDKRGYGSDAVLAAGKWIICGSSPRPDAGGETVGLVECPRNLVALATRVRSLIGDPPILSVTFAGRPDEGSGRSRHWAVSGLSADPVLAEFAVPWGGAPAEDRIYARVAETLLSCPRYEFPGNADSSG